MCITKVTFIGKFTKKCGKLTKNGFFSIFVMHITFERKVVENAATSHLTQNFALFQMVLSKQMNVNSSGI
jgi:hypothetical protein